MSNRPVPMHPGKLPPAGAAVRPGNARPKLEGGTAAGALLKIETDLRKVRSLAELGYFVANETRIVTRSQQSFFLIASSSGALNLSAVSAMPTINSSSPLAVWIEALVAKLASEHDLSTAREFSADAITLAEGKDYKAYPLQFMLWMPFLDFDGKLIGGLLQARMSPWTDADQIVTRHVAGACTYALLLLTNRTPPWRIPRPSKRALALAAAAVVALFFVPVSMSALAPVEVTPRNSFVVTAPTDGVVERILVEPNAIVTKDQPLVQMENTVLANRLEVAEREVVVAEAKLKKAGQLAFVDARGRHDLGVARAEMQLRIAERDYARDLLHRSTIRAERDGIAFFTDPKDLTGRPVSVGERLMDLADPHQLEFSIDLPVADAIVLDDGMRVKVFLDADPLNPVEARLVRADFQARPRENQQLAFRLIAMRDDNDIGRPLRLGLRGTAQIYSNKVPLAFYLFRRPLSAARQWIGL